jgi:hypothetical protein
MNAPKVRAGSFSWTERRVVVMQHDSGSISPGDLMAYIDGEAPSEIARRIADDPQLAKEAQGYALVQAALRQRLYRFDCPSSQMLGEYELGMLVPEERLRIARHVVECPHCTAELNTLRAFMAMEADEEPLGAVDRVRRFVATLVPAPHGAEVALRGAGDEATRAYYVNGVTITIDIGAVRRGRTEIIGLVMRDDGESIPPGSPVTLVGMSGTVATTEIDDLGNFAFDDVGIGAWRVEVGIGSDIILIEDLGIGT